MNATYYQNGSDYIAVTDEHPVGFKGVALVGRAQDRGGVFAFSLDKPEAFPVDPAPPFSVFRCTFFALMPG